MPRHVKIGLLVWAALAVWFLWQQGRAPDTDAIAIEDGFVIVRNQTDEEWLDVRIWVNEYYSGDARSIPAHGFVRESLGRFVASQGQKIDVTLTKIASVVVLGRTTDGTRIRVAWGNPQLH